MLFKGGGDTPAIFWVGEKGRTGRFSRSSPISAIMFCSSLSRWLQGTFNYALRSLSWVASANPNAMTAAPSVLFKTLPLSLAWENSIFGKWRSCLHCVAVFPNLCRLQSVGCRTQAGLWVTLFLPLSLLPSWSLTLSFSLTEEECQRMAFSLLQANRHWDRKKKLKPCGSGAVWMFPPPPPFFFFLHEFLFLSKVSVLWFYFIFCSWFCRVVCIVHSYCAVFRFMECAHPASRMHLVCRSC